MFHTLMDILPTPPSGSPSEIFKNNIDFFALWIGRIGGLIAFIGAIKFALSVKSEDAKEQFTSLMTMVAGFMIIVAVNNMGIFKIPDKYDAKAANDEFHAIVSFIGKWTRRAGALVMMLGSVALMFSMKDENAGAKVIATRTITAGAVIVGIAVSISIFI